MEGDLIDNCSLIFKKLNGLDLDERVLAINNIRTILSEYSPMKGEPVDCVLWVKSNQIHSNDYNPNSVAPPEMRLLEHSITEDGYTMPIVTWNDGKDSYEVVDGFHRHKVGSNNKIIKKRINGYLPISIVNYGKTDKNDRISSTIRHNRARGKHSVDGMSEIILDLSRRNWTENKIARELGMEADEVLRLKQVSGLAEAFADKDFSEAWEV